ncbi:hypothetical protein KW787_00270 [Candidatus Pacearchaeota archaeon]|nr:hypothetical protein [Candidatus Pacearchaeota archaeon]
MKKGMLFACIFLLLALVGAANNSINDSGVNRTISTTTTVIGTTAGVDKAYQCLENQIKNKTSFSLQEAVFGTLALGARSSLTSTIDNAAGSSCWPKGACTLKDTAQVALAYARIGKNTQGIEDWILSKNGTPNDLIWYVEIDSANHEPSSCTIGYRGSSSTINIGNDMKLSGNAGSCLSISPSGYWLKVQQSCQNVQFDISCDKEFVSTLLYQKSNGGTVYVAPVTHSGASLGTTSEKVDAQCLKTGSNCDYEGTLWAAIALQRTGNDPSAYVPYLVALAPDNTRYFPSAFIYMITGGNDYYSDITQSEKQGKYWEMTATPYNRFYDTSLGLLALQGTSAGEAESAKNYLLSIQTPQGCWNNNNVRDTAFILYSGWGKAVSSTGGTGTTPLCQSAGYSCEGRFECLDGGGTVLESYQCLDSRVCCSVAVRQQTCSAKQGIICSNSQRCVGSSQEASDGSCCLGSCVETQQQEDQCTTSGGSCSLSCGTNEEESGVSCSDSSKVCCVAKTTTASSGSSLWIYILVILIIVVALGIIFRNKIRIALFKARGRGGSSAYTRPTPPSAPGTIGGFRPMRPAGFAPIRQPSPVRRAPPQRDREMDETLKKLKEMSE